MINKMMTKKLKIDAFKIKNNFLNFFNNIISNNAKHIIQIQIQYIENDDTPFKVIIKYIRQNCTLTYDIENEFNWQIGNYLYITKEFKFNNKDTIEKEIMYQSKLP